MGCGPGGRALVNHPYLSPNRRLGMGLTTKSPFWLKQSAAYRRGDPVDIDMITALMGVHRETALKYGRAGKWGARRALQGFEFDREQIAAEIGWG